MKGLEECHIKSAVCFNFVTGGFTGMQPLHLAVNGPFNKEMKNCFTDWFARKVANHLGGGGDIEHITVDLRISAVIIMPTA